MLTRLAAALLAWHDPSLVEEGREVRSVAHRVFVEGPGAWFMVKPAVRGNMIISEYHRIPHHEQRVVLAYLRQEINLQ